MFSLKIINISCKFYYNQKRFVCTAFLLCIISIDAITYDQKHSNNIGKNNILFLVVKITEAIEYKNLFASSISILGKGKSCRRFCTVLEHKLDSKGSCIFPFIYQGKSYDSCTNEYVTIF